MTLAIGTNQRPSSTQLETTVTVVDADGVIVLDG